MNSLRRTIPFWNFLDLYQQTCLVAANNCTSMKICSCTTPMLYKDFSMYVRVLKLAPGCEGKSRTWLFPSHVTLKPISFHGVIQAIWGWDLMMTSSNESISALLASCAGNSLVIGEFPIQRPVTRGFDVYFDLLLNKRLSKQSWGWWFETPSCPLWHHCNALRNFWRS